MDFISDKFNNVFSDNNVKLKMTSFDLVKNLETNTDFKRVMFDNKLQPFGYNFGIIPQLASDMEDLGEDGLYSFYIRIDPVFDDNKKHNDYKYYIFCNIENDGYFDKNYLGVDALKFDGDFSKLF